MVRTAGSRLGKKRARVEKKARFLVVTEGAVTEPSYFERLRSHLETEFAATFTIRPKISGASKGTGKNWNPNPNAVVEHCIKLLEEDRKKHRKGSDVEPYAAAFAVVDVDHYAQQTKNEGLSQLHRALRTAQSGDVDVIVSNNKFEVWLLWHFMENINIAEQCITDQCIKNKILIGRNAKTLSPSFPVEEYRIAAIRADKKSHLEIGKIGHFPATAMPRFFEIVAQKSK
ncbi:MAG: RloB family protein [Corynebacterium sp.]|uniref:RloB family protein n=1 Tax=Corynebacterium sp. TaxID=1720 RepID=UPI0026DAD71B|nr:RloB family protein [Corynebacterium sp.]MDO4762578.1 RloB family protein [Corynebacterium sp.]